MQALKGIAYLPLLVVVDVLRGIFNRVYPRAGEVCRNILRNLLRSVLVLTSDRLWFAVPP
jgi:hypothetical protein